MYAAIAEALAHDVDAGLLMPGERLPTHRDLAAELGAARSTIRRAYEEAERQGLITSTVGRGTFVREHSPTRSFSDGHGAPRSDIVDLSFNHPLNCCDPDLNKGLRALARRDDLQELLCYQASPGIDGHRASGAAWIERYGLERSPASVVICSGAQHAIMVALSYLARRGETVLADRLTYPGIKPITDSLSLRLVGVEMDEHGMVPEAVDEACRNSSVSALYTIPTIHNPTSYTMPEERRCAIAELARRHDLAIIEDDALRCYAEEPPPPIAAIAPERSFFIATMTKTVAAGLRVAYLTVPDDCTRGIGRAVWTSVVHVSPILSALADHWIRDGVAWETVERKRAEAARRQDAAARIFEDLSVRTNPRSLYIWLELPEPWSASEFAHMAGHRGVEVMPAEAFSIGNEAPNAVRLCIGAPDTLATLERGLRTLRHVARSGSAVACCELI